MNKEQMIRMLNEVLIQRRHYRRSTMMPQRWEVIGGVLKPTDKLSPKKKTITHKMDMT